MAGETPSRAGGGDPRSGRLRRREFLDRSLRAAAAASGAAAAWAGAGSARAGARGEAGREAAQRFEPEYARGLEEVLIVYDQVARDHLFREVLEILGCLPPECTVRFLASKGAEAQARARLAERGIRAEVHAAESAELWGDWGRDIFQVSWREGKTVLVVPYEKAARSRGALTRGYEILRSLLAPGRDVRLAPLSFEGGNLAYDRLGRERVLFAGSSVLVDSDAVYRKWFGRGLPERECIELLKSSFSADRVVVLGRKRDGAFARQASLLFHIDLACAIVAEGTAFLQRFEAPRDADGLRREVREELELCALDEAERRRTEELLVRKGIRAKLPEGPKDVEAALETAVEAELARLREAEAELDTIRTALRELGYAIHDLPGDWRSVRRTQSYANALVSRDRAVVPIFPRHGSAVARTIHLPESRQIIDVIRAPAPEDYALAGANLEAYRLYGKLFRDVRVVRDAFFLAGGSVHCVVGAIG